MFGNTLSYRLLADTSKFESSVRSLQGKVTTIFAGIGAGIGFKSIASSILETGQEFDRYRAKLYAAYGDQELVSDGMSHVIALSNKLGTNISSTADGFSMLSAASRGTSLQGQKTIDIFDGVATAAAALKLSGDDTSGVLLALTQMISKGTVQAEELRGQLGERLPGAFQLAAQAMNMTTAELGKALQSGAVSADELLPKLAQLLKDTYGGAAAEAATSFSANMNRVKNVWSTTKDAIYRAGVGEALSKVLGSMQERLNSTEFQEAALRIGNGIATGIGAAASGFDFVLNHIEEFKAGIIGLTTVIGSMKIGSMLSSMFMSAMNPMTLAIGAIAAVVGALYYFRDSSVEVAGDQVKLKDVYVGVWDAIVSGAKSFATGVVESMAWIYDKVDRIYSAIFMVIAASMKGAFKTVVAVVKDMVEVFTSAGKAMVLAAQGNFSGAAKELVKAALPDQTANAIVENYRAIGKAAVDGWKDGGKLTDLIGTMSKNIVSGAKAAADVGIGAIEARILDAKKKREAEEAAAAKLGKQSSSGKKISDLIPGAASKGLNGTGNGTSSTKEAEQIAKTIEKYKEAKAAAEAMYAAEVSGSSLTVEARKKLIAETQAQNAATKAAADLGSKATAAQRKEVYDTVYATEILKQKTDDLAEVIRKKDESHKRAADLIGSYAMETDYLQQMIDLYKSGNTDLDEKIALLEAEKEIRGQLKDITDAADQNEIRNAALKKVQKEQELKYFANQVKKAQDMSRKFTSDLEGGLEDAIFNGKKLGDVFKDLAASFAKDMFKQSFNSLFGGSDGNGMFTGFFQSLIGGSSGGGSSGGGAASGGIGSLIGSAASWIGGFFADGGFTQGNKPIVVGERGPEIFKPSSSGTVIPNNALNSMGSGNSGHVFNINIQTPNPVAMKASMGQVSAQLSDAVRRGQRNR